MKVYALWNTVKKAYYSTGHGCSSGVRILTFTDERDLKYFLSQLKDSAKNYKIKRISVGG